MRYTITLKAAFVGLLFTTVLSAQTSFWDRFLPSKREPQVLKGGAPATPLVDPHPDVVNLQESFAKVAEAVKPAVVNISAVHITRVQQDPHEFYFGDPNEFFYRFFGEPMPPQQRRQAPREYRQEGTGSGVIIDPEGYILTNNHVVQGADQLTATLVDGKSYKGKVVGTDARTDLAVIRIKGEKAFTYAPLGDSSKIRIGDWALAFGSPFGLEQTVTAGIISAIRQSLNIEGRSFRNLLQTDAAINRGNSGGPLVNVRGEVIGINTAIYAPTGVFSGIGFAIPVNDAKSILQDLIQKGYVERSWMGVEIAKIDDVMAQQFGLNSTDGALVNQVFPDSPAQKAGMKRGDVILEFDGEKIKDVQNLQDIVTATPPDKSVKVKVLRDGSPTTLTLRTTTMPKSPDTADGKPAEPEREKEAKPATHEWLGATFSGLTPQMRKQYGGGAGEEPADGVVATNVPAESGAAEAGLMEGDIIRAVNRAAVKNISDFKRATASSNLKKGIVLDVVRQGRSFYLSYRSLQ